MTLIEWSAKKSPDKQAGKMLRVSEREALQIIESLSAQLLNKSPNTGRAEFQCDAKDGRQIYFSIAVKFEKAKVSL